MLVGAAVANMYSESSDGSSVVSQALYGQKVEILVAHHGYSHIQTPDHYQGWIDSSILYPVRMNQAAAKTIHNTSHVYSTPHVTRQKPVISLPFGVEVEVISQPIEEESRWVEIRLVNGSKGWIQRSNLSFDKRSLSLPEMLQLSHQFIGLPYTWGGTSSFGYDCSGFVQMLFREKGVLLPRDAHQQINAQNFSIVEKKDLAPGDLIFYGSDPNKIQHISLYLGQQMIIQASVLPEPIIKIYPVDEPTLKARYPYTTARRLNCSLYHNITGLTG